MCHHDRVKKTQKIVAIFVNLKVNTLFCTICEILGREFHTLTLTKLTYDNYTNLID